MRLTLIHKQVQVQRFLTGCAVVSLVTAGLGASAQAAAADGAHATPRGAEVLVNTTTSRDQYFPATATSATGTTLVAWTDTSTPVATVRARLLGRTGEPVGQDFSVAGGASGARLYPAVTALNDGSFAVVHLVALPGSLNQVWAQVVDRHGQVTREPVLVSETTTTVQFAPAVAALPGSRYVAVWSGSDPADRSDWDAKGRVMAAGGSAVTAELQLGAAGTGRQSRPVVTPVRGGFAAAWTDTSMTVDTSVSGITGRTFALNGAPRTADLPLNQVETGEQSRPSLTTLRSGRVAAAWEDRNPSRDGTGSAVVGRTFGADLGTPGVERVLSTTTAGNQQKPRVAATGDGGWLTVWEDSSGRDDPTFLGIRGRLDREDGDGTSSDFAVNTVTPGNQQQPALAVVRDRAVVVWTDDSRAFADPSATGVVTRAFEVATR